MAELNFTNVTGLDPVEIAAQTLTASDTFTLPASSRAYIQLNNATGGDLTVTMTGAGVPIDVAVNGYGKATFNNAQITVANGTIQTLNLSSRVNLLQGTVTVTGGDGINALLFTC